jgi:hypothetical protein
VSGELFRVPPRPSAVFSGLLPGIVGCEIKGEGEVRAGQLKISDWQVV